MKKYRAMLVGNGTMGKRHRTRFEAVGVDFVRVVDEQDDFLNLHDPFPSEDLDFAVIASPARTHYAYAKFFLERKIPVFVEKPLATTAAEAQELVDLAASAGVTLFVAQSECFNPIFLNFRKHFLRELELFRAHAGCANEPPEMANGACADSACAYVCDGVRLEFRREHGHSERCRDVDVSLDLLVHDLSMFLSMFRMSDVRVVRRDLRADVAVLRLLVAGGPYAGVVADFYADRESPRDVRTISVTHPKASGLPEGAAAPASEYSVSLVHYDEAGNVAHIPDSLDNEHRFFLKLLAGACGEWANRAARAAADVIFILH